MSLAIDSSSNSNLGEGSFFVFLPFLLCCEDGLELVVLVSKSFSAFVAERVAIGMVAAGISTLAKLTTNSLTSRYGSGVFTSSRGFSFCSVSFRSGGGAWLDPAGDPETSF